MNLELVGLGHKIAPSLPSLKNHRITRTDPVPACVAFRSRGINACVSPFEQWVAGDITGSVYGCLLTSRPELAWVSSAAPVVTSHMPPSSAALCPAELLVFPLAPCVCPFNLAYYIWEGNGEAGKGTGFSPNKAVMINLDRSLVCWWGTWNHPGDTPAGLHKRTCPERLNWSEKTHLDCGLHSAVMGWGPDLTGMRMWAEDSALCFLTTVVMRLAASVLFLCSLPWWTVPSNH